MWILKFQGLALMKTSTSELELIRSTLGENPSYEEIKKYLRKNKLNHLYQNIHAVMNALTPGCRQQFTVLQIDEIKRVFILLGFEGLNQKNLHKNEYIWRVLRQKLSFNTLEN